MKILYSCIPFDGGKSGIAVCMRSQVAALRAAGHQVTVIIDSAQRGSFRDCRQLVVPRWAHRPLLSMLYHLFVLPFQIRKQDYDFCVLGAANRRAFARYPLFTAAIVHDLSQYHIPHKYGCLRMLYIRHLLPFFVRKAQMVVAISSSTAADLARFWHIPENRLRVIPDGLSLPEGRTSGDAVAALRRKYGFRRPYLLYISRLEHPGKNHVRLIQAFERLPRNLAEQYDLVMAGAQWPGADAIFNAAAHSPLGDHFFFPGFVAPEDLPALYANAAGYVFPSLFEGFGLSLIEAMHFGVPCACSNCSSLGEIGRDCAILFDPEDDADITAALQQLLADPEGNAARIAAGKARAAQYTWENNARQLVDAARMRLQRRPEVLGVPLDTVTMAAALEQLVRTIAAARSIGRCAMAGFANAHCLNLACRDGEYRMLLNCAEAVWPDGSGVKLAGRILGFAVPENVNGTDMFPLLCNGRFSLFLLGGRPGVARRARENMEKTHPEARILGAAAGYFGTPEEEQRVIAQINAANPDLLLVGMGVPLQEKWIAAHRGVLRCGVAIGVGGLFDFASGRIPRAPRWLRRLGMEWLYRLWQEPFRLFRRYIIGNPLFLWRVLGQRLKGTMPHTRLNP